MIRVVSKNDPSDQFLTANVELKLDVMRQHFINVQLTLVIFPEQGAGGASGLHGGG
jgi:hypothetical protein